MWAERFTQEFVKISSLPLHFHCLAFLELSTGSVYCAPDKNDRPKQNISNKISGKVIFLSAYDCKQRGVHVVIQLFIHFSTFAYSVFRFFFYPQSLLDLASVK